MASSASSSQSLAQYRETIAALSGGKDANEEAWMTMWCSSNWAELLQPAPLSIALLGSVLCIASGTNDFSLLTQPPEGVPKFQWKYVRHPDSFKTCLMQVILFTTHSERVIGPNLTTSGIHRWSATATSPLKMHIRIWRPFRLCPEQIPDVIRNLVTVLVKGTQAEIELFFESGLNNLLSLSQRCETAATACEQGFQDLSYLTQELSLGCTYKGGTTQQAIEANTTYLRVLQEERDRKTEQMAKIEEACQLSKHSFEEAQVLFKQSVDSMPGAWSIFGMNVLEGLVGVVGSAASTFTSIATLPASAFRTAVPLSGSSDRAKRSQTHATPSRLTDPGLQRAPLVKAQILNLMQLLAGNNANGGPEPDWDGISGSRGANAQKTGTYVRYALQVSKRSLDPQKQFSADLIQAIDTCLPIIDKLLAQSQSADVGNTTALARYRAQVETALRKVDVLCQSAAYMNQMAGTTANGLVNPPTPEAKGKSAEIAVAAAQYKIDVTRSNLTASRDAYMQVSRERQHQQKMVPILRKAIGSFNILRARFSQLAQFFHSIVSLVKNVMGNHTASLMDALRNGKKLVLGGVSLPDFTRDLIYRECMTSLKVAILSTKVSSVYVEVSTKYILPAQRRVAEMLEFAEDSSPEGRRKLLDSLTAKQRQLEAHAQTQSQEIMALIERDQQQFRSSIDQRLARISEKLRIIYPAIAEAPPPAIQALTNDYIEEIAETATQESEQDRAAMLSIDDLM
ncbi:hypothetical protein EDB92DRAFT_1952575 [Lactarius akahatsu]|uniref:Uncharacterized protein n=1 Tax=Lactarius akahatsu TaxID=416441 RepID=A0AAD4Q3T7_9AGAM|nr:hypothetical protein EDB92DRAFT_1952575 [Lactarius akahatsu]